MEEDEDDEYIRQRALHFHHVMETVEKTIMTALRMLSYGASAYQVDKIARIGKINCSGVLDAVLLRNQSLIHQLVSPETHAKGHAKASKECAWQGAYDYIKEAKSIILEAVASFDTWIWHAFFGVPGAQNDLNVLVQSPVFDKVLQGKAPRVTYWMNDHKYEGAYYLVDDICPRVAASMFAVEDIRSIMMTCIILDNMIVKNEYNYDVVDEYEPDPMNNSRTHIYCAHDHIEDPVKHEPLERDGYYNQLIVERYTNMQIPYWHLTRQTDLIEHQWRLQQSQD
ncbi:hypothetical protein ACFX10_034572 [Malus domestica]